MQNEVEVPVFVIGERTQETLKGDFTVRKFLSQRQILQKDRLLRDFIAGDNPQISGQVGRADQLATVQTGIVKAPAWWTESGNGLELIDDNVLEAVYEAVLKVQKDAEKAVKERAKAAIAPVKEALKKADEE